MAEKMKAYEVTDDYCGFSNIIFASSLAKAKYIAFRNSDYSDFIGFLAYNTIRRCEKADPAYKGKECMDWDDPDDRLFLVKELGWACVGGHSDDCRKCVANEFCDMGMRYIEEDELLDEMEENNG